MAAAQDPDEEEEATQIGDFGRRARASAAAMEPVDRPYLIVLAGESQGRMYPISDGETVIGRGVDAGMRLQDEGVSRKHACVVRRGGELWLEDLKSANGTRVNGEVTGRRLLKDGDQIQVGDATILKFTYSDEVEEAFQRRLYDAALHDGLTKAFNKRHFMDRLPSEVAYARRHRTPLALTMLDIDHFKIINDTHGHPAGDAVLASMAQVIASRMLAEDVFARYGGEEFVILSRRPLAADAAPLAEALRAQVEAAAFEHEGKRIPVTISLGVAAFDPQAHATDVELVADADAALYEAKRGGRNRVIVRARGR
jgi:two-component system, cell cycle response regulator